MKVLVTGLFEMAALHAIRRFGQMGYEVHVAEGHWLAFSGFSKYVAKRLRVPNMRYHPQEYTKRIVEILETGEYDYYFPSYEEIIPMSRYRDRIQAVTKTVIVPTDLLMRLHDKKQLEELAHEIGVDSPKTYYPQSSEEARELIRTVDLPVVIKMRKTSGAAGFRKIYDRSHFEKTYFEVVHNNKLAESDLPMIQQLVEGPTTCTLHLCNNGEVVGEVMYQGLRTMPRTGGTTVFRQSVEDKASEQAAAKVIKHLNFSGLCGFDFIIDTHTGRPFLVDGNCRITPAVTMAYHGGVDLIEGWVRVANGEQTPTMPPAVLGVRTKMQFADFVWLLESYGASFKDWKGEHQLRKQWWNEKNYYYDIHSFSDPMPNIMIWVYIATNCYKLIFTNFDSAQLFIFHNQYVEK
ncbi:ATP-grasp domain-containing protein [Candidatus Bipolaricaulota bacterium]|nr:ATP-grasp domain-containing protein [Candidatus Bipolaricaulota bacterium]